MGNNDRNAAENLKIILKMNKEIKEAGGLFYQYRPCRRNYSTIYDIENIRNGVVFAQTPLKMNDPFDSQVGFSSDKIFSECINLLLSALDIEDNIKPLLFHLLKFKLLGCFSELITALNELKNYLLFQRNAWHKCYLPLNLFIAQNMRNLYAKCPKNIKNLMSKDIFNLFCNLLSNFEQIDVSEENIKDFLKLDDLLEKLQAQIIAIRDEKYVPFLKDFLSKLTISCFSTSGWNNPLMWSHYANSYSGICIEYDFSQISKFIGLIKKVHYSQERPTISLRDLGLSEIIINQTANDKIKFVQKEPNIEKILEYLSVKDTNWQYEQEWRIINIESQPDTKRFIDLPFIKSITFGVNIDPMCKRILIDICKAKNIDCFELNLSMEDFNIYRDKIELDKIAFDLSTELHYMELLAKEMANFNEELIDATNNFQAAIEQNSLDINATRLILDKIIEFITNSYFLKLSCNRICNNVADVKKEINEETINSILKIEELNSKIKKFNEIFDENILGLMLSGLMNFYEYNSLREQIEKLKSLSENYESVAWHDYLTN